MKMKIKNEPKEHYQFYNPSDTTEVLFEQILKKGKFVLDRKTGKEKKEDWDYICSQNYYKNINLLFSKFIPQTLLADEQGENKEKHLQLVINEFDNLKNQLNIFTPIRERNNKLIEDFKNAGFSYQKILTKCAWRFIIGLGASHPQETSMTLHHIYGIPYIPGSAVKGVTRHWSVRKFAYQRVKRENEEFEKVLKDTSKALEDGRDIDLEINGIKFTDLIQIFGTQKQAGKVIFMDAYPADDIKLKIDIMNVHYPDYYSRNEPPADWQNPNPIKFLTVEDASFTFYLISKDTELLNKAKILLKEALEEQGIGAKTSIGYGIFIEK